MKIVVLKIKTQVKLTEAGDKDKLTVKQIVAQHNVSELIVYNTRKTKSEIINQSLKCHRMVQ
jgi:hypothetical protein